MQRRVPSLLRATCASHLKRYNGRSGVNPLATCAQAHSSGSSPSVTGPFGPAEVAPAVEDDWAAATAAGDPPCAEVTPAVDDDWTAATAAGDPPGAEVAPAVGDDWAAATAAGDPPILNWAAENQFCESNDAEEAPAEEWGDPNRGAPNWSWGRNAKVAPAAAAENLVFHTEFADRKEMHFGPFS
eukprot:1190226-Prorocentrum_minimum.AAC.5